MLRHIRLPDLLIFAFIALVVGSLTISDQISVQVSATFGGLGLLFAAASVLSSRL